MVRVRTTTHFECDKCGHYFSSDYPITDVEVAEEIAHHVADYHPTEA